MVVRWGVLGAGWITDRAMAPAIAAARGAELHAIASRDEERAAAYAERFGITRVHRRYAELLADPEIDAVYVALANDAHRPWTIAALDAGKHVLCEKPLGLTAAEVGDMAAAAARNGRVLTEASWYRWHPRTRLAERLLREGAVGPVRRVEAGFSFAGVAEGNYRLDPAKGGGAAYDVGCYAVSAALWAFGEPPAEVCARSGRGPTGVDLTTELTVAFPGGRAEVRASIAEPPRQWLRIEGAGGSLALPEDPFTPWHGLETTVRVGTERIVVPPDDAYRVMVEQVSAVVAGDAAAWVVPLADSRATAAVLDAARASAAAGGTPVPVSP